MLKEKFKFNKAWLILLVIFLQACGSSKTLVLHKPEVKTNVKNISIVSNTSTTELPLEYQKVFETKLKDKLYKNKKQSFKQGQDLTASYRFIQFDEGSRFARWLVAGLGNAGEGSMTVETTFLDVNGKEVGKVQTESKIGSGFFGGSISSAVEKASEALAIYIQKEFYSK